MKVTTNRSCEEKRMLHDVMTPLVFNKMQKIFVDATTTKKDVERELSREITKV